MRKALIRLEDLGPGGHYESPEEQRKLGAVTDLLYAEAIPFHAAVISRFVDPGKRIDRTIAAPQDAVSARFLSLLHRWSAMGASLGMHGYTHQFGASVSGEGYEFAYPGCNEDCPPDAAAYTLGRFRAACVSFLAAGLRPDWFETPHYAASASQRKILEACSCVIYEDNPAAPGSRKVTVAASRSRIGNTYYVPTPLSYVGGASVERDVVRIIRETENYGDDDLASFFFHPFLEFPYIRLQDDGRVLYAEDSPLRQITGAMKAMGRRFVTVHVSKNLFTMS
ncbi:DUF2334 domain-containing protein [Cohnella candidum]|uniref:DUF2334 domain-containing protein n=1 Tax=Cohnella candidum TaxID=2674991 RepID=UPI0013DDD157|nr:DUF2334 domain-containing protein [Cohnella candidum]